MPSGSNRVVHSPQEVIDGAQRHRGVASHSNLCSLVNKVLPVAMGVLLLFFIGQIMVQRLHLGLAPAPVLPVVPEVAPVLGQVTTAPEVDYWATSTMTTTTTTTPPRPVCPVTATRYGPVVGAKNLKLSKAACYDLRISKNGPTGTRVVGCASPVGMFPGNEKYGCGGAFSTAPSCDAAPNSIKDTQFVWVVHAGCETMDGRGTYGYAYDDSNGLKQCSPQSKYEWVLCPSDEAGPIEWDAEKGISEDSMKRFRVTNQCKEPIWIQQASAEEALIPGEATIMRLEPGGGYTYSIPNRGLPSTRLIPKTGCDSSGNNCDVQSMPPCPPGGCDHPIDTKFEASWGCLYAQQNKAACATTAQGDTATYQDWWDGSAVDGWTLPFSILVDDGSRVDGWRSDVKAAGCGSVVCAKLVAETLCPQDEFLVPEGMETMV